MINLNSYTMSNKKQFQILRNIVAVSRIVIGIFGLWPYAIQETGRQRRIEYNFLKLVYSLVFPLVVIYSYYTFGVKIFRSSGVTFVQSNTLQVITGVYTVAVIIGFLSSYAEQHFKYHQRKLAYCKCNEIIELLKGKRHSLVYNHIRVSSFILQPNLTRMWI